MWVVVRERHFASVDERVFLPLKIVIGSDGLNQRYRCGFSLVGKELEKRLKFFLQEVLKDTAVCNKHAIARSMLGNPLSGICCLEDHLRVVILLSIRSNLIFAQIYTRQSLQTG